MHLMCDFYSFLLNQNVKFSATEYTKTHHLEIEKFKIFWGRGTAPPQTPLPARRGPLPHTLSPHLILSILRPSVLDIPPPHTLK